MTSVTSRATFQNSDVIFIWLDISNFENNNKDIKAFQIKIALLCFRFPIHIPSVLFLFANDPEKKKINFVQSNRYVIFGVVPSANCEICILCVCSSIFI
jgi:hypothetical protein